MSTLDPVPPTDPAETLVPGFIQGSGTPLLSVIGEAPGEHEVIYKRPFVGNAGNELRTWFRLCGIEEPYYLTNVFPIRPPNNSVDHFFGTKQEGEPGLPGLRTGKYVLPQYAGYISRLRQDPIIQSSRLLLALGNTALWALTGRSGIANYRGFILPSLAGPSLIATFHPAAVLRELSLRTLVFSDIEKARDLLAGVLDAPSHDSFSITLVSSIAQLRPLYDSLAGAPYLSVDVETSRKTGTMTMIGFGSSGRTGCCIPLWNKRNGACDWSPSDERIVRSWIQAFLSLPCPKVFHNASFDIQILIDEGLYICGPIHDTMLIHHALQPEMRRKLGTLTALHLNHPEWKSMAAGRPKDEEGKEDE